MTDLVLHSAALLVTAWLFGGMLLFAAGFAAFLFKSLPPQDARALIRKAFPHFYLFVIAAAALAAALLLPADRVGALWLGAVALSTVPTRQWLMPAVNAAADGGQRRRFSRLHTLSVLVTLGHIVATAGVLLRLTA